MPWFMTPFGPQYVIEPGNIAEFTRRDYAPVTAQQAAAYYAGSAQIPDVSFVTGQELEDRLAGFSGGGGTATTDASLLTSGILPAARIGDSSIALSKLAFNPATQAELDTLAASITEAAQDATAAMVAAGTHTGASFAYDDTTGALSLTVTASGGGIDPGVQFISVKSHGAVADGVTDNRAAFIAALNAAKALVTSSGHNVAIYMPSGTYRIIATSGDDTLAWDSGISLIGAGKWNTKIVYESVSGATSGANFVRKTASLGTPLTDCHFRGFELDMTGSLETASYNPTRGKGFYMQYCKRCSWSDLTIRRSKATAIGVDFLIDCRIQNNDIYDSGNFTAARGAGDSGIGIGSGMSADEYCIITGNIVSGSRNHGIFIEKQGGASPYWSRGFMVANNECRGNFVGIGDKGGQGALIIGNTACENAIGISVADAEVGSGGSNGRETLIVNNIVSRNTATGIDLSDAVNFGRVTVRGNRASENGSVGIRGDWGTSKTSATNPAQAIAVVDNDVHDNASYGLSFGPASNSGYARDLHIERNRIFNNGKVSNNIGVRLKMNVTRIRLVGNVLWDDQATRTVTDGVLNSTTTVTSATAVFNQYDVGRPITGTGIPASTTITGITSATSATMSAAATATATAVSLTIGNGPTQTTGINLLTGVTITGGVIRGNDARGCTTPWAAIGATLAGNLIIESNPGLNMGGPTAVTVGASPFTYTAGFGPEDVYIDGGTVTTIAKGATTVATTTNRMVRLSAGEAVTVTYSVAPTMVTDKR